MPLLPIDQFRADLRSPCCQAALLDDPSRCSSCAKEFPRVGATPVLIDFDHSAVDHDETVGSSGASQITRTARPGFVSRLAEFFGASNEAAPENIEKFLRLVRAAGSHPRVLVVGGGVIGAGAGALYTAQDIGIIAFDIYQSGFVQVIADGHRVPLRSQSVDGVVIQAVLEHVLEPELVVSELRRVLRPGGIVYADTPFMQQVHEGPYDFTRYTESGHRYLFRHFAEVSSGAVGGVGTSLIWSIAYFFRGLFRSRGAGRMARVMFFWLRWFDRIIPAGYAIDGACGCYFLGTLAESPISGKEAVRRYRGAAR
jgi:SAM-dependent methyltransferase